MEWSEHLAREQERYREGEARLPGLDDADARQKQLTRMGNAAGGAGLALLMEGRDGEAAEWFSLAAERYRESFADAPPGSWGRPIGAIKSLLLGGDWEGAEAAAGWALDEGAAGTESPIGKYAACLALLVLAGDRESRVLADDLRTHEGFPVDVADSLAMISAQDVAGYVIAVENVLESFETREDYLEDIPVADTVIVLQALAGQRNMAAELESPLLPRPS
ncbi:MAG: hypothetical protein H0W87_10555 [Actinobacteria bacterium]|nr:hypothetical protein [Actinomycetota bacterium]